MNKLLNTREYRIPVEPKKIVLSSEELNFGSNQANVSPEAVAQLKANFPFTPETNAGTESITITGYSDSMGTDSYNLALSKKRADAVKNVLISVYNVSPDRLTTEGKGESEPIAKNESLDGKAQNRRVEFVKQ